MPELVIATVEGQFQWEPCNDDGPLPTKRGWYLFTVSAPDKTGVILKFYPGGGATLGLGDKLNITAWAGPILLPSAYR